MRGLISLTVECKDCREPICVAVTTGDDPPAGLSDPFRVECGNCKGIAAYPQSALVAAKACF